MLKLDKIKLGVVLAFNTFLILAGILAGLNQNWLNLALALFSLFLGFLPDIIRKRLKISYPSGFEIVTLIFIYASIYLGAIQAFYEKLWWWDSFLHAFSGIVIGIIGFALIYVLNKEKALKLTPAFNALFAFTFAITMGVIWEIFEFTMDSFFLLNMQESGLVDTMWDLIVDAFGALLIALVGYFYLKKYIKRPRLFRKKLFGLVNNKP